LRSGLSRSGLHCAGATRPGSTSVNPSKNQAMPREVVLAAELIVPDARRIGVAGTDRILGARFRGRRRLG